MENQCSVCVPHLINSLLRAFVDPMQSKERLEILFIQKQYFFLIREIQIILFCRLLTQTREHNLINKPLFDENGTCIQGLDGYQDSRMAR